jgi:hypothetical protein
MNEEQAWSVLLTFVAGTFLAMRLKRRLETIMTVHVMGPPDPPRPLKLDERLCTQPDAGQIVVFHVDSTRVGQWHRCNDCGETDSGAKA